jgi:hypothetical protein
MLDLPQGVAFVREVKSSLTDAQYREFIHVLRAYRADKCVGTHQVKGDWLCLVTVRWSSC